MKKIILLLATFIISANAINCLEAETMLAAPYEGNGYKLDSATLINGNSSSHWYTYPKFIHSSDELALRIECEDSDCDTLVIKTSIDANQNMKYSVAYWNEELQDSTIYYNNKDSIVWVSTEGSYTYMNIKFKRNDTLYKESYNTRNSPSLQLTSQTYMVMNPSDNNRCYEYTNAGELSGDSIQIETEGSLLTVKRISQHFGDSLPAIYFFSIHDEGITSITRKVHPATINRQYHYFDLMGRPAKGKNIIRVVK